MAHKCEAISKLSSVTKLVLTACLVIMLKKKGGIFCHIFVIALATVEWYCEDTYLNQKLHNVWVMLYNLMPFLWPFGDDFEN